MFIVYIIQSRLEARLILLIDIPNTYLLTVGSKVLRKFKRIAVWEPLSSFCDTGALYYQSYDEIDCSNTI